MINHLRNLEIIAWSSLIFGILLYVSDKVKITRKIVLESKAFKPYEPEEMRPGINLSDEEILVEVGKYANTVCKYEIFENLDDFYQQNIKFTIQNYLGQKKVEQYSLVE